MKFDIVVVGSGIAGLSFSLKSAKLGYKVAIVTKKQRSDTNTNHAQGGIASVTSCADDFNSHVQDTLIAGDGLCHEDAVRAIVSAGPEQIKNLIEEGVEFSKDESGEIALGKEGGHSQRRILHVKDYTGRAIEEALLKSVASNKNISVFEHHFAIDLILKSKTRKLNEGENDSVVGLYVYDTKNNCVKTFTTKAIMLSTGGTGCVYQYTTNPEIATGDGIAMAFRGGAKVANLEFIQFHPTAMYTQDGERFLISEAVRGEGAILRNAKGEAFMARYDQRKDLAPRDIVARAIDSEMKRLGTPHVWLDITHKSKEELSERFPQIYQHCLEKGIDISMLDCDYESEKFYKAAKGLENEREGGARCAVCFKLRLEETAKKAKELDFDIFGTTLTVSPHKNAEVINAIGLSLSQKHDIPYLESNFKKQDGYKRSVELSKENGIYRQAYCGCEFALKIQERECPESLKKVY